MRWPHLLLILFCTVFASKGVLAQSENADLVSLPMVPTAEQLTALTNLTPLPFAAPTNHHRPPAHVPPVLTPEQIQFRESVRALGKDNHHFVHVELKSGKVQTGAIVSFDDSGLLLRNGIIHSNRIAYSQLKSAPIHVPAVGTHVANGFKWAALGTGIGIGCAIALPVVPIFLILAASGAISD
jgi:hypothetical protein